MPSSEKLSLSFFAKEAYNRKSYSPSSPLFNRSFAAKDFEKVNYNN
jgi:hypothetical protein